DLMPTVLDLFALPPVTVHGRSLLPLGHGTATAIRDHACSVSRMGERLEMSLRTPQWGYILPVEQAAGDPPRVPQLYVKPDDRWEVNNVIQHHLDLADELNATLRKLVGQEGTQS